MKEQKAPLRMAQKWQSIVTFRQRGATQNVPESGAEALITVPQRGQSILVQCMKKSVVPAADMSSKLNVTSLSFGQCVAGSSNELNWADKAGLGRSGTNWQEGHRRTTK